MRLYKYAVWLSVGFCAGCGIDNGYSAAPFGQTTYGYAQPGLAYAPDYAPSYGYAPPYGYAPVYGYTAPYQPAPSYGLGLGFFGGGHRDWRERGEWREHEHFDRGDTVPERTIGKWLRKLKLTRLQPRPYHPKKDQAAQEDFKKRARIGGPPMAVETGRVILNRRGAAEGFLVDLTP
jgi:hypothetical protein